MRSELDERQLARRVRGWLVVGAVLELAVLPVAVLVAPAAFVAAACAVRATWHVHRVRGEPRLWAGAALLASFVPLGTALLAGVGALVLLALVGSAALGMAWWTTGRLESVRHRRWLLERRLRKAGPMEVPPWLEGTSADPRSRAQGD